MDVEPIPGLSVYPASFTQLDGVTYYLARLRSADKVLGIQGDAAGFTGEQRQGTFLGPLTAANAAALRRRLPWLQPELLGLKKSAGCGDRLGLATPGHIRALRAAARPMAPILAQQSIRENARTGRTPQQVMDDAMWGVFQEGWREPWGADADHLKTTQDIDVCVAAGYTFFTIDPGDHVDNEAHTCPEDLLAHKVQTLPWDELEDSPDGLRARYLEHDLEIEGMTLRFEAPSLARAAAKYGRAIAHSAAMYRHLAAAQGKRAFELEVSVDETETPTSPLEHLFVASELRRLGVQWVSLAPRYVGRFEKGVDYIGDLAEFEAQFAAHAAIGRALGPYKLSLHSGSDKFSIYPIAARHARELVHLKTAGTSYLEGLRVIAAVDPGLFRRILAFALECYDNDRATYHVSASRERVLMPDRLSDGELASVLDLFDGRQVLHVTFGSLVDRLGGEITAALALHEEAYYAALEAHFRRHILPFVGSLAPAAASGSMRGHSA
jgi:hypothetical protein